MTPTQPSASALKRMMQQQLTTGRALLALAELSERAIIDGDTDRLQELSPQQKSLLDLQLVQEEGRHQAACELAQKLALKTVPTLTALLPLLSPADAIALARLRTQILAVQRRLESQNRFNAQLLENALGFVKFNLQALMNAALKPARYGVNLARLASPSFYVDSKA